MHWGRQGTVDERAREDDRAHAARTRLARLVGSGLLRELGTGPQDPKRRYFHSE